MLRTGKLPPRPHPNTLLLDRYLTAVTPAPPASFEIPGTANAQWPIYLNDTIGDCTIASACHHMQAQAATRNASLVVPEADVISAYAAVSGYNPATGENDDGAVETDVLHYWQTAGIGGHRILGWSAVSHTNQTRLEAACYWLAGLYVGVELPITAQKQFEGRQPWDVVHGAGPDGYPGSWGGHAINITKFTPAGLVAITWGRPQLLTWRFWMAYGSEAYGIIDDTLLDPLTGRDFAGLNLPALLADAHAVAGR